MTANACGISSAIAVCTAAILAARGFLTKTGPLAGLTGLLRTVRQTCADQHTQNEEQNRQDARHGFHKKHPPYF